MINSDFFTVRSIQKVFLYDAIKNTLFITKPFMMDNVKACRDFMGHVIDYVVKHDSRGLYPTFASVMTKFRQHNINNGLDLVEFMMDNKDILTNAGYKMDKIKTKRSHKEVEYKSFGRNSHIGMDVTRTLAVRSKLGGYEVKFYEYDGAIRHADQQMTNIKMDYHYATGCKYYDVRPILLSTWLNLPADKQNATCNVDVIGQDD